MIINRCCIVVLNSVFINLLSFSICNAEFDSAPNKSLEKRLHNIYVSHYDRPVLDSDWFNILENVTVQKHSVVAGDTLWGISKVYFGDGNYWSKLWSVNKSITNPHLIFVGDIIYFNTGSFNAPPSISVEKAATENITEAPASEMLSKPDASVTSSKDMRPLIPIPDVFENTESYEKSEEAPIEFIARPPIVYQTNFQLTRDILEQAPEVVGKVQALGQHRMVTAEGSLILIDSSVDLSEGSVYTILKQPDSNRRGKGEGHQISIQGTVSVVRKLDGSTYEAKVLQQYESIELGDYISTYRLLDVNIDITSNTPIESPIKIVSEDKTIWAPGETIFLKSIEGGSLNVGDVLKVNNKFNDNIEFYVTNGYIKVVSTHPPYATGLVVNSREHVRENSVSTPTYTGWSIW